MNGKIKIFFALIVALRIRAVLYFSRKEEVYRAEDYVAKSGMSSSTSYPNEAEREAEVQLTFLRPELLYADHPQECAKGKSLEDNGANMGLNSRAEK